MRGQIDVHQEMSKAAELHASSRPTTYGKPHSEVVCTESAHALFSLVSSPSLPLEAQTAASASVSATPDTRDPHCGDDCIDVQLKGSIGVHAYVASSMDAQTDTTRRAAARLREEMRELNELLASQPPPCSPKPLLSANAALEQQNRTLRLLVENLQPYLDDHSSTLAFEFAVRLRELRKALDLPMLRSSIDIRTYEKCCPLLLG